MSEKETLKQFLFDKYGTEYPELCSDELHDTMQEYAKSYALQVVREAVENEKNRAKFYFPDSTRTISKHAADRILSEIESKLTEES